MGDRTKGTTKTAEPNPSRPNSGAYRVRLPGFIGELEVGLGDAIKRATTAVGIKPCGGCQRRAAALNRSLVFFGRRSR
jgi:hypothetical protein